MGAAATKSDRYVLDVRNLEKIPSPPRPRWFDDELARLMPPNTYGEPFLKIQWGMDATQFRNGDPNAPLQIAAHQVETKRIFRRLDAVEGVFEYFLSREEAVKAVNIRLLPSIDYKDNKTIVHYGPPRWLLTGWISPERLGTPEEWARNRYASITLRGGVKVRLDCNGPFPSRGRYQHVWTIEGSNGEFRDLDRGVMTEIERRVAEHKRLVSQHNDHTDAQELRDTIDSLIKVERQQQQKIEEDFIDYLGPSRYRLIEGNAWSGSGGSVDAAARALKS